MAAFLAVGIAGVQAQNEQRGYTKTKGRLDKNGNVIAGERLPNVSVILQGDNATVSDAEGSFKLTLRSDRFYIRNVSKQDYAIVDPDILQKQYFISKNDLILVLQTPEEQAEDRFDAERQISRALRKQLEQREDEIERLREENKLSNEEYRRELKRLYDEKNNEEKMIAEKAKLYSKMDFDQIDDFNREIIYMILSGELSKADSLLNARGNIDVDIEEYLRLKTMNDKEKEELARRRENLNKSISYEQWCLEDIGNRLYRKFEIAQMSYRPDSAAYYIEKRAQLDPTNPEWQRFAGFFASKYLADYDKALSYHFKALDCAIARYGEHHPEIATIYSNMGSIYLSKGMRDEALKYQLKSLDMRKKMFGNNHPQIAESCNNLGSIYSSFGLYDDALRMFTEASNIWKAAFGEQSPFVALSYNNIGDTYSRMQRYDLAFEYNSKALNLWKTISKTDSNKNIATSYINLGYVYMQNKEYELSLDSYEKALEILEKVMPNSPDIAMVYNNIAGVYLAQKRYDEALKYRLYCVDLAKRIYGEEHVKIAEYYNNIGYVYSLQNIYDKAMEYYTAALDIAISQYGEIHSLVAACYNNIGYVYHCQGDETMALQYKHKSDDIKRAITSGKNNR